MEFVDANEEAYDTAVYVRQVTEGGVQLKLF